MKENIKKIINLIILTILAVGTFIIVKSIPSFLIKEAKIDKTQVSGLLDMAPNAVFEVNPTNLVHQGDYYRVIVDGIEQIYCAQKGGSLKASGYYTTYEDVKALEGSYESDGTCSNPGGKESYLYYEIASKRKATPREAFILTWPDPDWDSWSSVKQEAIWDTDSLSQNLRPPKETVDGIKAEEIDAYATYYEMFANSIGNGSMVKGDATNQDNVKISVSRKEDETQNEYIGGPFTINYVNGIYGITFGGISNMYIVGEKTPNIQIKSFIIDGKEIAPSYFRPVDDKQLIGVGTQGYPKSGESFYVKYIATEDEQINKIHADFAWMEAQAEIIFYDGYRYKTEFNCTHTNHCHGGHPEDVYDPITGNKTGTVYKECATKDCCFTCEGTVTISKYSNSFQKLLSATGNRILKTASLEISIPDHKEPQPEPPAKNLQIKLAGYVWEDEDKGKESLPNGIKDQEEKMKAGIEVILHNAKDNSVVKTTVTDENGYYEFNDLNAQKKYYIEFVYDGQIYQATTYDTNIRTEEERLTLSSNGTMKSSATEIVNERITFNNNFAEINSALGSYKVRRALYYNVGASNTAYIVTKPSTETPYGIKEIYDYVIEQAIATKSYSEAYENALNRFGNNDTVRSKLQFIEDCRISSYTGYDTSTVIYPIWDNFMESAITRVINGVTYKALYPTHLNIDFGLNRREEFDLALRKDVEKATIEINGKTHTYTYDTRNNMDEQDGGTWDIGVRLSDLYYNTKYSRELFGSDYIYKASNYGDENNQNAYGKNKADELNVYVTYKLTVRNQSQSVLGEVMEIVDYYDSDYEYVEDRSYIEVKYGISSRDTSEIINTAVNGNLAMVGTYPVNAVTQSKYADTTEIAGYDKLYITGLQNKKLSSGQTAYIYLTFKVKKDNINGEDWIRLDEQLESMTAIGVGKENIAEINGFRTYYREGSQIPNIPDVQGYNKVAGLFDIDSVPGNLDPNDVPKDGNIKYENFEDDTDKAPNIRLILYRDENGNIVARTMDGIVWDDERTVENNNQKTNVGNGIKDGNEKSINGVTVQLVELMDNGTEYVWKTFSSGQCYINNNDVYTPVINMMGPSGTPLISSDRDTTEGKYIFKSYMPGNFVVRFIYGDTVKTVLPNTNTDVTESFGIQGQNSTSYNGQDYKSTTYQNGIAQSNNNDIYTNNTSGSYTYNITASDVRADVSDAKDIMTDDNLNKDYGRQNATLNSREDVIGYSNNNITNYIAEVLASHEKLPLNREELNAKLNELMAKTQMTAETGRIDIEVEYDRNATGNQVENNDTTYKIQNLNLGLEERPKAQLSVNKEVTNIKLTLADGSTLFDATQKASNVLWRDHKPYEYKYQNNKLEEVNPIQKIRDFDAQYGLIQLSMDEELMHGATIKISYKVTVTNVGEVDYKDNQFYYTGITQNRNIDNVVTSQANQLVDYVANNLQFYAVDNTSWKVIDKAELINSGLVNSTLAEEVQKYNTVITTSETSNIANSKLTPQIYDETASQVSDDLILTQLITSENDTDDLTYRNIVEIVKTSNDVGRRNAFSVVGNQKPTNEPTEVDSDRAEVVRILPPYGNGGINYIIATIVILSSAILISGIIFIKKKVLK